METHGLISTTYNCNSVRKAVVFSGAGFNALLGTGDIVPADVPYPT